MVGVEEQGSSHGEMNEGLVTRSEGFTGVWSRWMMVRKEKRVCLVTTRTTTGTTGASSLANGCAKSESDATRRQYARIG